MTLRCSVCDSVLGLVLPLDQFDFDETPEDVGATLGAVVACSDCWRRLMTAAVDALSMMKQETARAVLSEDRSMLELLDTLIERERQP